MKHKLVIGKYTLESLTNGMYTTPLDIYREYIQNAVDSFDKAIDTDIEDANKLVINIDIDETERRIRISDNGCGIPTKDAVSALLDVGNSQKSRITSRGFRGIGRLAGLSYCDKLKFQTSYLGEDVATIVEFDALLLKELLLPGTHDSESVEDVIEKIVTVRTEKESATKRYFKVELEGVWNEAGLVDIEAVKNYLLQHVPLQFSKDFQWRRTITEKILLNGYIIPQYRIRLNGEILYKPYTDSFTSDRVKKNTDYISDVMVKTCYRNGKLSAILWYAKSNFYGTIIDNRIKGIRIRQGNILIGDKSSCNLFFKEERFNGWMIGELHVIDTEIIVNSRRDGFEKNTAYYELLSDLKEWAFDISKYIRHLSYERSLSSAKKDIVEAERLNDIADENELFTEDLAYAEDYGESSTLDQDESSIIAETDFISKLGILLNEKKAQTKYAALNINSKLTIEQRKILERVFDLITEEYEHDVAEMFVNTIATKF